MPKPRYYKVRGDMELPEWLRSFANMIGEVISQPYADTFSLHFGASGSLEIPLSYLKRIDDSNLMAPIEAKPASENLTDGEHMALECLVDGKPRAISEMHVQAQSLDMLLGLCNRGLLRTVHEHAQYVKYQITDKGGAVIAPYLFEDMNLFMGSMGARDLENDELKREIENLKENLQTQRRHLDENSGLIKNIRDVVMQYPMDKSAKGLVETLYELLR